MTVYDFFPNGTLEVAYVPGETLKEAVERAIDNFPQGGRLCHNGNFVKEVSARMLTTVEKEWNGSAGGHKVTVYDVDDLHIK